MNVLSRAYDPILQSKAAEISNRYSYHLHGLLTILEDYYKINLFSSHYQGNTAKNLTDERIATRSVSTDTEDSEWTVAKWERLQREHAKFSKNYLSKSWEFQVIRRELVVWLAQHPPQN
ncbi:hypothetical protein L211DRAFT_580586 [Terfezia boudieri ATCC MYA-4762]|uniref:Uncharacterized protein n=1 Tax=Terfezia boudieri ATCC MYA-4762 TaxID=1051890 RepID=A0A3N4LEQ1_9PEZI|nr:hypothetical protein L211DRAFT_580586 [Terfezia boudieri ATCC MYA-4762]